MSIVQKELATLVKKNREIPTRFCYTGLAWKKVATDQKYSLGAREMVILKKSSNAIVPLLRKPLHIIHLGIGTGREIPTIVHAIRIENILSYSIVDINPAMLNVSAFFVQKHFGRLSLYSYCQDIESQGIQNIVQERKNDDSPLLVCLTGNGVLYSNTGLLFNIQKVLTPNDAFFFTLELYKKEKQEEIFASYLLPSVLDLVSVGIQKAGFFSSLDQFSIWYNPKKCLLEIFFNTGKEKILVLRSYKPKTVLQVVSRLEKIGFQKKLVMEDKNSHSIGGLFGV